MLSLKQYLDDRLAHGRSYFSREEALKALGIAPRNFAAAATRLINKGRLANPRHGFFLILRPEDKTIGALDPVRWIDLLMEAPAAWLSDFTVASCSVPWLIASGCDDLPCRLIPLLTVR